MSHHTVGCTGIGGQPCTPHPTKSSATIRKITATADQRQQCPISNLWGTRIGLMEVRRRRGVAIAEACDDSKHKEVYMSRRALSISVLATLLFMGGVSAEAADHMFTVRVENVSVGNILKLSNGKTAAVTVAPVLYVIHTNRGPLFTSGEPDRGKGLEALSEDGATGPLAESLKGQPGIVHVGSTDMPVGASGPGDIEPGGAYEFKVTAKPG